MDCSTPGFPVHHHLPELLKLMSIKSVMPSNHLLLCCPLLLLPSIFPNIRVFSNESPLCIKWPKYWSFSFNISPSNEYSVLISFRMDWLDLLATKELSKVFSNTTIQKHQFFSTQLSAELKVELGPIVYFCIFFLCPWKTELRKYSYNLCLKMFYVLFCELHCLWPYI